MNWTFVTAPLWVKASFAIPVILFLIIDKAE